MPREIHVFEDFFTYVDAATTKYFMDGAATVAGAFQGTAYTLVAVYVMLYGWSMMTGLVKEPVTEGTARILKATFIVSFATNSALYAGDVASFLYEWPSELAGVLSGTNANNTTQLVDNILGSGLDLSGQAWETASFANIGGYIVAFIIFSITIVVTAITAVAIISSKFGLALLLAIGPIFILSMLFNSTRKLFDAWLGVCVSSGFTIVLVSMSATLIFKYFAAAFDAASSNAAANSGVVSLGDIATPTIVGIIAIFFIHRVPNLAGALGGGVSTASADAAGWAYDKIRGVTPSPLKLAKAGYNKYKANQGTFDPGQKRNSVHQADKKAIYRRITGQARHERQSRQKNQD